MLLEPRPGLKSMLEEYERSLILAALHASGGHQRRAARSLGILPSTLVEKMKRLGIRGRRARPLPEPTASLTHSPAAPPSQPLG